MLFANKVRMYNLSNLAGEEITGHWQASFTEQFAIEPQDRCETYQPSSSLLPPIRLEDAPIRLPFGSHKFCVCGVLSSTKILDTSYSTFITS
jgi:hypothetical protein